MVHNYIICIDSLCINFVVAILLSPENATACRGGNVTISCEYLWSTALPVTWIINGTSFTQQEVVNSPLYQLNNPYNPRRVSLTVFSINGTTTFQCIVYSIPNTASTLGTVTVIGMYMCTHVSFTSYSACVCGYICVHCIRICDMHFCI